MSERKRESLKKPRNRERQKKTKIQIETVRDCQTDNLLTRLETEKIRQIKAKGDRNRKRERGKLGERVRKSEKEKKRQQKIRKDRKRDRYNQKNTET